MNRSDHVLKGDFLHQAVFVGDAAQRILALQDREPLSPSFGSFHLAYWRDKTSEFADARYQEAGAAMALLADPLFDALREERNWPSRHVLIECFDAAVLNLSRIQYAEGSYDEWYKGERGFAATAFTTFSFSMAALQLGDALPEKTAIQLRQVLRSAAAWLSRRNDLVKTNHQVVAAAALAAAATFLNDEALRIAARSKMASSLEVQTEEGWFPELGGMDFGYSALILDYLHHYCVLMSTDAALPAASRLFDFMSIHMSPGIRFLGEAGICGNSYPGQVGYLGQGSYDIPSGAAVDTLSKMSVLDSERRIQTYLFDDLRLCRWANLPLLAAMTYSRRAEKPSPSPQIHKDGWTVHHKAGVASFHQGTVAVHVPYVGGAIVEVTQGGRTLHLALDYVFGAFSTRGHDPRRTLIQTGNQIEIRYAFKVAKYLYPGLVPRLVLRFGSMTSVTSRLLRALIDRWRMKAGTAVNQSATAISRDSDSAWVVRRIIPNPDKIKIVDEFHGPAGAVVSLTINGEIHSITIGSNGQLDLERIVEVP